MNKFFRRFLVFLATTALAFISVAGLLIAVARALLPETCTVSQAQIDTLELEKTSYAGVAVKLGCDGVLKQREDYSGQILIEDYAWRGDGWPYAHFQGHFINGVLHGTDTFWLNLSISS